MIFVPVGTWRLGFDRLIRSIDELAEKKIITDNIFAQIGHGTYKPNNIEYIDFCPPDEYENRIMKADIIISHAGMGTISHALEHKKPIVVLPRKRSLEKSTAITSSTLQPNSKKKERFSLRMKFPIYLIS